MKSTKILLRLRQSVVPFAFLLAFTQVACMGTQQEMPPPQPEPKRYEERDFYEVVCTNERLRGDECPSREEWYERAKKFRGPPIEEDQE